jgi:hypothetical protein
LCFFFNFLGAFVYSIALLTRVTWNDGSKQRGSSVAI